MRAACLNIVALVPFSVHVLAGFAALKSWDVQEPKVDTQEYWQKTFANTLSIFVSADRTLQYYSTIIQSTCAVLAAVTHFLGPIKLRRLSYCILLSLCVVTLMRHFINNDGPSLFGCLYAHVAFYAMLVFYQEHKENVPQFTHPKLS